MSSVIADSPTRAPAIRDRDATDHAGHAGRGREPEPSRIRVLLQALADVGACIDPTGVLACRRLIGCPRVGEGPGCVSAGRTLP